SVSLSSLVHRLSELHRGLGKSIRLGLDVLDVLTFRGSAQGSQRILDSLAILGRDLVAIILERLLRAMQQRLGLVAGFHQLPALLVGSRVSFGVLDHLFDVGIGKTARSLDAYLLLLARALVFGRNV